MKKGEDLPAIGGTPNQILDPLKVIGGRDFEIQFIALHHPDPVTCGFRHGGVIRQFRRPSAQLLECLVQ
jgi:hypothetical protein